MPGRMGEVPRQFPLPEDTTRRAIDFGGSHARTDLRDRRLLRLQHRLVQPSSFSRRPSDMHSTRAIRTITGEYNTKIADYEPPAGDARVGGPAVHNRRALSGSQYRRERHAFGPGATGLVFHGGGDFDLAHARPNLLACDAERKRAFPFSADANRSRMPAVSASASMPTEVEAKVPGIELLRCPASHFAAAISGDFGAMTIFTCLTFALLSSAFAWVRERPSVNRMEPGLTEQGSPTSKAA